MKQKKKQNVSILTNISFFTKKRKKGFPYTHKFFNHKNPKMPVINENITLQKKNCILYKYLYTFLFILLYTM